MDIGTDRGGKEITLDAKVEKLDEVLAFMDRELEALDCPVKAQMQLDVALEELFVNVAHYAYRPGEGQVTVRVEAQPGKVAITLTDRGVPYDPLARPDPDLSLSAEDRQIGGLGIYMVKKTVDSMEYVYRDGQNVLTITKSF